MADVLFFLHKAKQSFLFSQQNLRWVRAYVLCPGKRRREKAVVINAALLGSLVALEPFWWSKIVSIVKSSFHFYCKPLFSPSHCHRVTVSVGSSSNITKTGVKFLHHRGRSKLPFPLAPSSTSPSNHHFSMYSSSREMYHVCVSQSQRSAQTVLPKFRPTAKTCHVTKHCALHVPNIPYCRSPRITPTLMKLHLHLFNFQHH